MKYHDLTVDGKINFYCYQLMNYGICKEIDQKDFKVKDNEFQIQIQDDSYLKIIKNDIEKQIDICWFSHGDSHNIFSTDIDFTTLTEPILAIPNSLACWVVKIFMNLS